MRFARLNGNGIGPEGAGHLAGALMKNRGLEAFSIGDNPLRREGRRAITLAINANPMSQLKECVGNCCSFAPSSCFSNILLALVCSEFVHRFEGFNFVEFADELQLPPSLHHRSNRTILAYMKDRSIRTLIRQQSSYNAIDFANPADEDEDDDAAHP